MNSFYLDIHFDCLRKTKSKFCSQLSDRYSNRVPPYKKRPYYINILGSFLEVFLYRILYVSLLLVYGLLIVPFHQYDSFPCRYRLRTRVSYLKNITISDIECELTKLVNNVVILCALVYIHIYIYIYSMFNWWLFNNI
jgi:hypothetical protein